MNKKWKVRASAIECLPPPLLVFRAHSFKFHQGLSKKWLLQDMYGTWQRPTRTLKTNENVVRERQHTRNRFFFGRDRILRTRTGARQPLARHSLVAFLFFLLLVPSPRWPQSQHSRKILIQFHILICFWFSKTSPRMLERTCVFFRIIFGRDCPGSTPGSSAGQILFEKIPMGFKMDLLVIGSQDARNSSKRVRRKHESR